MGLGTPQRESSGRPDDLNTAEIDSVVRRMELALVLIPAPHTAKNLLVRRSLSRTTCLGTATVTVVNVHTHLL